MARANLVVDKELIATFVASQNSTSYVRSIQVRIADEAMVLGTCCDKSGNTEEDYNSLITSTIEKDRACFVLFDTSDVSDSNKSWLLICWIPDTSKVRDKMLYSSSREDLKQALGLGYFTGSDMLTSSFEEMTWTWYLNEISLKKSNNVEDVLTISEQQIRQEEILSRTESTSSKATAMGVLPFEFHKDALNAVTNFSVEKNWLDLYIDKETVFVGSSKASPVPIDASTLPSGPRFILLQDPVSKSILFIYYCPEETSIRDKMTMSSAKVCVLSSLLFMRGHKYLYVLVVTMYS